MEVVKAERHVKIARLLEIVIERVAFPDFDEDMFRNRLVALSSRKFLALVGQATSTTCMSS
jgi:hypothetical protein